MSGNNDSGIASGFKFVTSTVGNTVGGVTNTVGGVVGAAGRGVAETVEVSRLVTIISVRY